jgi:hypothetical protein
MKLIARLPLVALCATLFLTSCGGDSNCNSDCVAVNLECDCCPAVDSSVAAMPKASLKTIAVFLETSGSMAGFMPNRGATTSFQRVVPDVLSRLQSSTATTHFYSIKESSQKPLAYPLEQARDGILRGSFQWGNYTSVPVMLDTIEEYRNKEAVSILISDMIYSPDDQREVGQAVTRIREKIGNSAAASLIAVHSDYATRSAQLQSPYYLLLQGNPANITAVKTRIYEALNTYDVRYDELNFGFQYTAPYYSILPYSEHSENGIANACYGDERRYLQVRDIDTHDTLSFWVGVDLKALPSYSRTTQYLQEHLKVEPAGAAVERVEVLDKQGFKSRLSSEATDKAIAEGCTHFIKVRVYDFEAKASTLSIALQKDKPSWIAATSHDRTDSIDSKRDQTFGLGNIYTAFHEKYEQNNNTLFFKPLQLTLLKK